MDPIQITSTQFRKLLDDNNELSNYFVKGNFTCYNFQHVKNFSNCTFEAPVKFADASSPNRITFINCIFREDAQFSKNSIYELIFENCEFAKDLNIIDCSFKLLCYDGNKIKDVNFIGDINSLTHVTGEINFKSGYCEKINITAKSISCQLNIGNVEFDWMLFSRVSTFAMVRLNGENCNVKNLSIEASTFNNRLILEKCNINNWIYIIDTVFNERVIISDKCFAKALYLTNVNGKNEVSVKCNGNLSSLTISSCNFEQVLTCYYPRTEPINDRDNQLSCNIDGTIQGNLVFQNLKLASIDINCTNFGNILFNEIYTSLIHLQDFHNQNKLTLSNLRLDPAYNSLIIFDSNINNTEFVNIDFRKFTEIVIAKSDVSNMLLSNSILPPKIQIKTNSPTYGYEIDAIDKIDDNMYFRENYRQLNLAMTKQGNQYAALVYKAKEMHYLRKELKWSADKFLLQLNYLSNNHGTSWFRGAIFTLTTAFVFFLAYNFSLLNPHFVITRQATFNETIKTLPLILKSFTEFIKGFPGLKISGDLTTWISNVFILLSRIFIGYGVYQTIMAFRKYSLK